MGIKTLIFLYHQTSETSIGRSLPAGARFWVPPAKAAAGVGTPLTEKTIRAGVLLLPAGLRAIEQSLGGYRESIPIPIDEFFFLGRFFYFGLYPVLYGLYLPLRLIPHSAFRPAPRGVQGSPEPRRIQGIVLNLTWFRAHSSFYKKGRLQFLFKKPRTA
jgi:hypothetical protein